MLVRAAGTLAQIAESPRTQEGAVVADGVPGLGKVEIGSQVGLVVAVPKVGGSRMIGTRPGGVVSVPMRGRGAGFLELSWVRSFCLVAFRQSELLVLSLIHI